MLKPDVSWREQYASAALNRKFFGIIPVGVYRGYDVTDNGDGTVSMATANSVAVTESNGYSLTVSGSGDPEVLSVPEGEWLLVIESTYDVGVMSEATAKLIATELPGRAVVARITNTGGVLTITPHQRINLAAIAESNSSIDFGELTIDLGEADQNLTGELVDLGEL